MKANRTGYHVALIMDGNGRWATDQDKPRLFGHAAGVETVKTVVREAKDIGVHTISLYAFAIANWKREQAEVDGLWELFNTFFASDMDELISEGVRVRVIGNRAGLPEDIRAKVVEAEERSKNNDAFLLQIALNYDGVEEVARMVKQAITDGVDPEAIDTAYVLNHLDTEADNQPDLMVRTGAKAPTDTFAMFRHSSFLTVQFAQAIGISTTTLWPDFTTAELRDIIAYADPDARLFGGQRA